MFYREMFGSVISLWFGEGFEYSLVLGRIAFDRNQAN